MPVRSVNCWSCCASTSVSVWSVIATKIFWPAAAFQLTVDVKSERAPVCWITAVVGDGLAVWVGAAVTDAGGATDADGLAVGWAAEHAARSTTVPSAHGWCVLLDIRTPPSDRPLFVPMPADTPVG